METGDFGVEGLGGGGGVDADVGAFLLLEEADEGVEHLLVVGDHHHLAASSDENR